MKLWEPKRKCPKVFPTHLQNHVVWSRTVKCSVKSYVTGPSTKCYFAESLFMRVLTHDKPTVVSVRSVMTSRFYVRPTSKRWFLKIVQVKHDAFWCMPMQGSIHVDFTSHLAFTYLLCWSLKRSVKKWTWTGSAFSTNESAWSVMVTDSQSHVWRGPNKQKMGKVCISWLCSKSQCILAIRS